MSIIDSLLINTGDAHTEAKFTGLAIMGRLSEAQIAFGKAIIASPERFEDARATAGAALVERYNARIAAEAAKVGRRTVRLLKGKEIGSTVEWTSKSRNRQQGVIVAIDGETLTIDFNGQAVTKTASQVGEVK